MRQLRVPDEIPEQQKVVSAQQAAMQALYTTMNGNERRLTQRANLSAVRGEATYVAHHSTPLDCCSSLS